MVVVHVDSSHSSKILDLCPARCAQFREARIGKFGGSTRADSYLLLLVLLLRSLITIVIIIVIIVIIYIYIYMLSRGGIPPRRGGSFRRYNREQYIWPL